MRNTHKHTHTNRRNSTYMMRYMNRCYLFLQMRMLRILSQGSGCSVNHSSKCITPLSVPESIKGNLEAGEEQLIEWRTECDQYNTMLFSQHAFSDLNKFSIILLLFSFSNLSNYLDNSLILGTKGLSDPALAAVAVLLMWLEKVAL